MAADKLILCASVQQLLVGIWRGAELLNHYVFTNNDEGHAAFDGLLKQHLTNEVYLIADSTEEEYRIESLPHTTGKDRAEMLARRLAQFGRNSEYRATQWVGQDTQKRREDLYLFVMLSSAEFMQMWIDLIQANQMSLIGVYLLPMLNQSVLQQMKLQAPDLLLCERLSSGLRQTYISDGKVRLSRLIPMQHIKPNQLSYFYLVEIEKTRLYLLSQRLMSDQTTLQLILPAIDENTDLIAKSISQEQSIEAKVVDVLEFAKHKGLSAELVKEHPELVHMQLLANGYLPANLAPSEVTMQHRVRKATRTIQGASVLVFVLGLLSVVYSLFSMQGDKRAIQEANQTLVQFQRDNKAVLTKTPATEVSAEDMKQVNDIVQALAGLHKTPSVMYQLLHDAQIQTPQVKIAQWRWVQTPQLDWQDIEHAPVLPSLTPSAPVLIKPWVEIAILDASIQQALGVNTDNNAVFERFLGLLKANPALASVEVLARPSNPNNKIIMQGSTQDRIPSQLVSVGFKLKLTLKSNAELTTNEVSP